MADDSRLRLGIVGEPGLERRATLAQRFPAVEVVPTESAHLDALLTWHGDARLLSGTIRAHSEVRWVHSLAAGIAPPLLDALEGHQAVLTNGSGPWAPPLGEHVVGVLLAHYHRFWELRALQERADWQKSLQVGELYGKTVGIVGLGDVGLAAARLLRPFGVRLLGIRRGGAPLPEIDELFDRAALPAFLARLDVLVVAAPLTPETRGMIGARELSLLPQGAYLVNVARGPLVVESALIDALRSGHLSGAALDVFDEEPLPPDNPLWSLPNVFISPHCADNTERAYDDGFTLFLDLLDDVLRTGQPGRNVVNRALGY